MSWYDALMMVWYPLLCFDMLICLMWLICLIFDRSWCNQICYDSPTKCCAACWVYQLPWCTLICRPLANLLIKKKISKSFQTWLARSFASCLHWRFVSAEFSSRSSAAFQQYLSCSAVRVRVPAGSTIKQPRQDVDQHRPSATQPCLFSAPCLCRFSRFSMLSQCRLLWWPGLQICSQPIRVERDPGFGPEPRLYRGNRICRCA